MYFTSKTSDQVLIIKTKTKELVAILVSNKRSIGINFQHYFKPTLVPSSPSSPQEVEAEGSGNSRSPMATYWCLPKT